MGNTKLGFMNVPNGDAIAFDMKESEINPSVVYLSHDDGEGHGYILGKDFNTYLEQLLLVSTLFPYTTLFRSRCYRFAWMRNQELYQIVKMQRSIENL